MHSTTTCTATLDATPEAVWAAWADMPAYPTWDEREEETRLDGPFETGTTGWSKQTGRRPGSEFTLTEVTPRSRWTNELPLPAGRLVIDHRLVDLGDGRVEVTKTYVAHGPMAVLFAAVFARGIRKEMPASFRALQDEARRRTAGSR